MKPRFLSSLVIFLSAYAPLAVLFVIRDWNEDTLEFNHSTFVLAASIFAVGSLLFLYAALKAFKGEHLITPKAIEYRSNDLVEYTIPYLISFFSIDFGKWPDVTALIFFMVLLFVLNHNTQTLFVNPVLALIGYGLYDTEFEENGKSRKVIILAREGFEQGTPFRVDRISQYLFVAVKPLKI